MVVELLKPLKSDEDIANDINDKFEDAKQRKSLLHDEWWTNHAFVDGKQYVTYRNGRPQEPKAPSWRVRLTHNMLVPIINTICAKLTQQRPTVVVRPNGIDDERIQKAQAAEKLLEFLDKKIGMQQIRYEVCWWAAVTGTGFFRRTWDPEAGDMYNVDDGAGNLTVERTGAPRIEAFSPFDVYPDEQATSLKNARWVILAHMVSADTLVERWPKAAKRLVKMTAGKGDVYHQGIEGEVTRDLSGYTSIGTKETNLYRVLEYEERPGGKYPDGRRVVVCQDAVLEKGPLPSGRFSLTMVRVGELGGRFWGKGSVTNLIPLQREMNRTISTMVELRNLHSCPIWVGPAGSVPNNAISNRPDAFVTYNPNLGPPPTRLEPVPISASLESMLQRLTQSFYDISGIHEVSQGRGPSGVISGRALGLLSDMDSTRLGPAVRSLESAMEDLAIGMLEDWKLYMTAPITVSILGQSRQPEVFKLHASDLDSTDVEVIAGSMLPKHHSFERELALNYFQVGAMGPPQDPATQMKLRQYLGTRGLDEFYDDSNQDRLYAQQENDMLTDQEMAQFIRPQWYEDHSTHVDVHRRFMLSPEFRDLGEEVQEGYNRHLALHYHELTKQQQGQATYAEVLGMEVEPGAGAGGAPQQQGGPGTFANPRGGQPEPAPQPGLVGGGTPELNRATNPGGPGVNMFEESTGAF